MKRVSLLQIMRQISGNEVKAHSSNEFFCFNTSKKDSTPKKVIELISQQMFLKPQKAIELILGAFETPLVYLDYQMISLIIKKLISDSKEDMLQQTFLRDLYPQILKSLKSHIFPETEKIFLTILTGLPKVNSKSDIPTKKCVSKLYGAALHSKQLCGDVDLKKIFAKLQDDVFVTSIVFAEFLVQTAMQSKNMLKRTFACMHLTKMHTLVSQDQGFCINYEIMLGTILVLFNDRNSVIRNHGANLAEAYV